MTDRITIVIDGQEKAPWKFSSKVVSLHLPLETGDYTLKGHESRLTIERKSLDDLVKTVIHDWLRFSRQLRRMAAMDYAAIVVEAPLTAVTEKKYGSDAHPNSIIGKLNMIYLDFGVPTLWLDNRNLAAEWVENLFIQYLEKRGYHI